MKTCETCKHWDAQPGEATGECSAACDCADFHDRIAFAAQTNSDERAYLVTGADFGCAAHEPRE